MTKFVTIVLCMFAGFSIIVNGDTITLKNDGKDVDLRVTDVKEEHISAIIVKKDLKFLQMQFLDTKNYPDVISLNGTDMAIECKIKEITEDAIQVLIPTSVISSLKMSLLSGEKQVKAVPDEVESKPKAMDVDVKKEKKEQTDGRISVSTVENSGESRIADEIRTSPAEKAIGGKYYRLKTKKKKVERASVESGLPKMEVESVTTGVDEDESVAEEKIHGPDTETSELKQKPTSESLNKESADTVEEGLEKEKPVVQDPNLGKVEGRILHSGKPLPDCQVKLQMLEKGGVLTKGYRPVEGAIELEAITDNDGVYHFMNVSPGLYKLYWKHPSEATWVRRFKMEPDVIVESGRLTNPKEIETLKRTLN